MAKDRTVFVIGAGAGEQIQMPLGRGLLSSIASTVYFQQQEEIFPRYHGDQLILKAIEERVQNSTGKEAITDYLNSCNQIIQAAPFAESIDHLVHLHKQDSRIAFCAKLAITRCILNAERGCRLFENKDDPRPRLRAKAVHNTWYTKLIQLLCRGVQFDGVVDRLKQITFIIFNYDRCVETFLYEALQLKCGVSPEAVADALKGSKFIHPYGHVGVLPWQAVKDCVHFGDDKFGKRLAELSRGIRTFHEQQSDQSEVARIQGAMQRADRIAFLGFAYHSMNMQLLYPDPRSRSNTVLGTTYRMTPDNIGLVTGEIRNSLAGTDSNTILLQDLDCKDFMEYFDRRLSFA